MFLLQELNKLCVRVILTFCPKIAKATFLSTRASDCRGGTGLKTVFVSVCGNLQHISQNIRFLKLFASLYMIMPYIRALLC